MRATRSLWPQVYGSRASRAAVRQRTRPNSISRSWSWRLLLLLLLSSSRRASVISFRSLGANGGPSGAGAGRRPRRRASGSARTSGAAGRPRRAPGARAAAGLPGVGRAGVGDQRRGPADAGVGVDRDGPTHSADLAARLPE